MRLSKKLVGLAIATGMLAVPVTMATSASAAPNDNACHGQVNAYYAQNGGGIGNFAKDNGLSVKELHAILDSICP
jgi:hypothetical protein